MVGIYVKRRDIATIARRTCEGSLWTDDLAIYAVLVIWSEARILFIALLLGWFEVGRDRALENDTPK